LVMLVYDRLDREVTAVSMTGHVLHWLGGESTGLIVVDIDGNPIFTSDIHGASMDFVS
jgi:hypothetical protein